MVPVGFVGIGGAAASGVSKVAPDAAWSRPIGLPLESPGIAKNGTDINDGYWQGAPVGGTGSGTGLECHYASTWFTARSDSAMEAR